MVLLVPFVQLFTSFALIFISCELAERLTDDFNTIEDILNQWDWYLLPLKMRRLLPTLMINLQVYTYNNTSIIIISSSYHQ